MMPDPNHPSLGITPEQAIEYLTGKRDVMGMVIVHALKGMEQLAHQHGWDQPPRLFRLARNLAPSEVMPEGWDGIALSANEIGIAVFAGCDGPEITRRLIGGANQLARFNEVFGGITTGFVLLNEAWMLLNDPSISAEELRRVTKAREIHKHAKRVEIRFLLAVDNTGTAYQLSRRRDTDELFVWADSLHDDLQSEGGLVDGLRALMEAAA